MHTIILYELKEAQLFVRGETGWLPPAYARFFESQG